MWLAGVVWLAGPLGVGSAERRVYVVAMVTYREQVAAVLLPRNEWPLR